MLFWVFGTHYVEEGGLKFVRILLISSPWPRIISMCYMPATFILIIHHRPLQSPCIDYLILTLHFFLMYFRNLSLWVSLCFRKALWSTLCIDLYICVLTDILKSTFNRWASKKLINKKEKRPSLYLGGINGINVYMGFYYRFVLFCFTQWREIFPIYSVLLIFPISLISLVSKADNLPHKSFQNEVWAIIHLPKAWLLHFIFAWRHEWL